ncbi:MAG TPA: C4-dicarboxylate ABC transporter permease [Oceanospirillaceae bacterium]|mgnify:CR=1 FL=1|nr:C4-dicarboxylate ABC transporter permease [Oceanospirillaceae bacterium]
MYDWPDVFGVPLWGWLFVLPSIICLAALFRPQVAQSWLAPVWRRLDKIYQLSGAISACFMVLILLLIVAQMIARWSNITFAGSTEFAGYAMACTSFFALAYALTTGAHIRVSVLLNWNDWLKYRLDVLAMYIAALIATYFARYAIKTNLMSAMLNDTTQGQDQIPQWLLNSVSMLGSWPSSWKEIWSQSGDIWVYTPMWLPQIAMSIGSTLLAIALWDHLIRLLVVKESQIKLESIQ